MCTNSKLQSIQCRCMDTYHVLPCTFQRLIFSICVFSQNKNSDFCAPLTSFDWNEVDPNLLGTSSIDTTCTIWGLEVTQCCILFYYGAKSWLLGNLTS